MHWQICLAILQILSIQSFGKNAEVQSLADNEYLEVAKRAVKVYNDASNDAYRWKPIKILNAHTALNVGLKYTISAVIARTNCTKNVAKHSLIGSDICATNINSKQKACIFEVHQIHWKIAEKINLLGCSEYTELSAVSLTASVPLPTNQEGLNEEEQLEKASDTESSTVWKTFENFIERFERVYESTEERWKRFRIFKRNMRTAQKLQSEEKGSAIYGETQFSDLTREEFRKKMLPMIWPTIQSFGEDFDDKVHDLKFDDLPDSFDWRTKSAVTPVKNQGSCGSCWAFSVTGNIEGLWAIKTGNLISLSEQELLDCDVIDKGCNGGLPINAFKEIVRMGGLMAEEDYPYKAHRSTCHLERRNITVYINDSVELPRNETVMKAWIAQKGPLSVGVDADLLMFYRGGVLHPSRRQCPPSRIDHGVLIVGYGVDKGMPYWLIKNSWGPKWGEAGYFRMLQGKDVCGIRDLVSSALIY